MKTKTAPLTKGHNSYPWELEDLTTNNCKDIVDEKSQYLFNFHIGVLVCEIRVVFKVML
jgi:hypothetical protein